MIRRGVVIFLAFFCIRFSQGLQIPIDAFPLCGKISAGEIIKHILHGNGMVFIGILQKVISQKKNLQFFTVLFCHGAISAKS